MKHVKFLVLLTGVVSAFSIGSFAPPLTAMAAGNEATSRNEAQGSATSVALATKSEAKNDVLSYDSIDEIPSVLPDGASEIHVKPDSWAYQYQDNGKRGFFLSQVISEEGGCIITFSVPEISVLDSDELVDAYDIEFNRFSPSLDIDIDQDSEKRILMVTAEFYGKKVNGIIAKSWLFVYNPAEDPELTISFEALGDVNAYLSPAVTELSFTSKNAVYNKVWADGDTNHLIESNAYQSSSAAVFDYAQWGDTFEDADDVTFSSGEIILPLDLRKKLVENIYDYNDYLAESSRKYSWYDSFSDYWQDKDYSVFSLDAFAKSLGADVQNPPTTKGDKVYLLGNHLVTVGCFAKDDSGENVYYASDIGLDTSWVSWNERGVKTAKSEYQFDTHNYNLRSGDQSADPVKIDDEHYLNRWDFDFLVSLLEYCASEDES